MSFTVDYSFLDKCINHNLCFAAYSLPYEPSFKIVLQKDKFPKELTSFSALDEQKGFVMFPFDHQSNIKRFIIRADFLLCENESNHTAFEFVNNSRYEITADPSIPYSSSKSEYLRQFKKLKNIIEVGEIQKLVLSRVINKSLDGEISCISLFKLLNSEYPGSFNYLLYTPFSGIWMGATPEQLLRIDSKNAITVALAGTQANKNIPLNQYVWGIKEIHEQKFVLDFVEKTISDFISKSTIKKSTENVQAADSIHLKTSFSFKAEAIKNQLGSFLKKLHPTPAVCGLPKSEALQIIRELESHQREYYTGFLGTLNLDNHTDLFVNLRCLKWLENTLSLFVGGGITSDSVSADEWNETNLKARTLTRLINKLKQFNEAK